MFVLVQETSAGHKPPDPRNEGRPPTFENVLQVRNNDVIKKVDSELPMVIVCGATTVSDAATVHQRPVSNFMLKQAVRKLTLMVDLVGSTTMHQNGEGHDVAWQARKTVNLAPATPNDGYSVVLVVGDIVAQQSVMFDVVESTCLWISKQLGICHGSNRVLTIVGAVPAAKIALAKALEAIERFLNFKVLHMFFSMQPEGRTLPTPCDSRYGFNFIALLRLL